MQRPRESTPGELSLSDGQRHPWRQSLKCGAQPSKIQPLKLSGQSFSGCILLGWAPQDTATETFWAKLRCPHLPWSLAEALWTWIVPCVLILRFIHSCQGLRSFAACASLCLPVMPSCLWLYRSGFGISQPTPLPTLWRILSVPQLLLLLLLPLDKQLIVMANHSPG